MQEIREVKGSDQQSTWLPRKTNRSECTECPLFKNALCQSIVAVAPEGAPSIRTRRVKRDEVLFQQGEAPKFAGVLRSGILRMEHMRQDGDRLLLGLGLPGTIFGMYDQESLAYSLEVAADSEICVFQPWVQERLRSNTAMRMQLMKSADRQHAVQLEMIWRRGALSSRERIIAFLLMAADHMPVEPQSDGSLIVDIGISRKDWAAWSDVSVESISRTLSQLSERDLVSYLEPGRYRLQNLDALSSLAGLDRRSDRPKTAGSAQPASDHSEARLRAVNAVKGAHLVLN